MHRYVRETKPSFSPDNVDFLFSVTSDLMLKPPWLVTAAIYLFGFTCFALVRFPSPLPRSGRCHSRFRIHRRTADRSGNAPGAAPAREAGISGRSVRSGCSCQEYSMLAFSPGNLFRSSFRYSFLILSLIFSIPYAYFSVHRYCEHQFYYFPLCFFFLSVLSSFPLLSKSTQFHTENKTTENIAAAHVWWLRQYFLSFCCFLKSFIQGEFFILLLPSACSFVHTKRLPALDKGLLSQWLLLKSVP